jgi:hypothetical protein
MRLARAELECYRDPLCAGTSDWTVKRLDALLENPAVDTAMDFFLAHNDPHHNSPPLIPTIEEQVREQS